MQTLLSAPTLTFCEVSCGSLEQKQTKCNDSGWESFNHIESWHMFGKTIQSTCYAEVQWAGLHRLGLVVALCKLLEDI